ncbi:MAG TPA: AbrB/MazE/SpoVT family DNA-binding domain-containing protein [Candidatus Polarisedimenticolaceae bacterium]|nr:AbrB/MazE/SpoVT family DNA-binding domain-containing protein [Candidatus Polarisedimenticolaceae bacterium]
MSILTKLRPAFLVPSSLTYRFGIDIFFVLHVRIDGDYMNSSTVSPKFQVVIPKPVRERLGLVPGQRLQVLAFDDRIELVPVKPIKKMRGFLKGIDSEVPRDDDRL